MKIAITSPRAPIVIEWVKIMQRSGHSVTVVDSLYFPVAKYSQGVHFVKVSPPKLSFETYKEEIRAIVKEHDLTIPTCEDIFFLSMALADSDLEHKVFIPENKLLFNLHNKFLFKSLMNQYVRVPEMELVSTIKQIDLNKKDTLLKPVFSRFGRDIVRDVNKNNINGITISEEYPWVQQQFINGNALCNYSIIQNGEIISHVVYKPKYLVNGAASTYFEYTESEKCNRFIEKFAQDTNYNGQVAFDFIDDGTDLYILECNPRATSGLHLISDSIEYRDGVFISNKSKPHESCRVSASIYIMFGLQYLLSGQFKELKKDYKKAFNVAKDIPLYAQLLTFLEMFGRMLYYRVPFTTASTFDIEYDG